MSDTTETTNKPETAPEATPKKVRNIALADKLTVEVYKEDKIVNTLHPSRNLLEVAILLKTMEDDAIVSIYAEEDPERSDPVEEGKEMPRYNLFKIDKLTSKEALKIVFGQMVPETACLEEFQKLCDYMGFRSTLKVASCILVFKGGGPAGFSYVSKMEDATDGELLSLYDANKKFLDAYKEKCKSVRPRLRFSDDKGIITL